MTNLTFEKHDLLVLYYYLIFFLGKMFCSMNVSESSAYVNKTSIHSNSFTLLHEACLAESGPAESGRTCKCPSIAEGQLDKQICKQNKQSSKKNIA